MKLFCLMTLLLGLNLPLAQAQGENYAQHSFLKLKNKSLTISLDRSDSAENIELLKQQALERVIAQSEEKCDKEKNGNFNSKVCSQSISCTREIRVINHDTSEDYLRCQVKGKILCSFNNYSTKLARLLDQVFKAPKIYFQEPKCSRE